MRTERRFAAVRAKIAEKEDFSVRRLAKVHKACHAIIIRRVHEDMSLKSCITQLKHLVTPNARARRVERAQKLLNRIKNKDKSKIRVFSDENIFTTDAAITRPNSRYPTDLPVHDVDEQVRLSTRTKAPGNFMGLGFFCSDGQKCPQIFHRRRRTPQRRRL